MNNAKLANRVLEIIPGAISWAIIIYMVALAIWNPVICAVLIIVFEFYWIIRTLYLTTLLVMAYHKLARQKNRNWLNDCKTLAGGWQEIYHLVIFPVYKEGLEIIRPSLKAIDDCNYPKEKMIIVMAFEERNEAAKRNAEVLQAEFKNKFFACLFTFHPDAIAGEARTKGANATWAARHAKEFLEQKGISLKDVIISCFDADTCVEKEYFGCLTYHFLTTPRPHQASYQPMPVYNNNIWHAPSFARLVEISSSFCQLIESIRLEKFVTFSSHSMSFKTLVEIGYWPVNMISDDSVVYWKAFLFYKGDYRVIPLYITVSMDVAYSHNFFKTIAMQYKQKRRWAWGVENFPFLVRGFWGNKDIPLVTKIKRSYHLLESHITWAVWAVIIMVIAPLPIIVGGTIFKQMSIGYNLPQITGLLLNFTLGASFVWLLLSLTILPPRPKDVPWFKNIVMVIEWVLVPFIILILGSTPALDAQTHLMLAKYMEFYPTEKIRGKPGKTLSCVAILSLSLLFCLVSGKALAESAYSGERIVYAISPMGVAEYNDLGAVELENRQVNLVTFRTQVMGFDDTEKIYSDPLTSLPLQVERDIRMWLSREKITERYDPKKFTLVITKFKDGKKAGDLSFTSSGPIQNAILLPFYLRRIPNLGIGWRMDIRLPNKFEVKLISIEDIKVPAGKFSAYHFVSTPAQFEIWISNDSLRLPLKIKDTGGFGYSLLIKEHNNKR